MFDTAHTAWRIDQATTVADMLAMIDAEDLGRFSYHDTYVVFLPAKGVPRSIRVYLGKWIIANRETIRERLEWRRRKRPCALCRRPWH